jgi:membrane-associated protease RseP (regulator of RpoE activity)
LEPVRDETGRPTPPEAAWHPRPKFRDRVPLHVTLFVLTILTTTTTGASHYLLFQSDFQIDALPQLSIGSQLLYGLWYSATILAILGFHEIGHYLACRYYDVDASLPFFLPAPIPLTGTFGAFIRIREPIPTKRMLFDIGIAGPLAGFLVALPALFLGLSMSRMTAMPTQDLDNFVSLGEPLLFKLAAWLLFGSAPDGYSLNMHPMAFAAWFGLIATALNLVPIGQLDGGHISYAVLGRRSSQVALVMVAVALVLAYFSTSWIIWTGLMIGMLLLFGRHHPRTPDEEQPLDRTRLALAAVALIIFIVCFTPAPIEPLELIGR